MAKGKTNLPQIKANPASNKVVFLRMGPGVVASPLPIIEFPPIYRIQLAMLDVAGGTRGTEDTTKADLQKAWPKLKVEGFSDPAKLMDEWLEAWPDFEGPKVKIYYVVSSGLLKVIGKVNGETFERSFQAGEDLPGALAKAKDFVKEKTKTSAAPGKK